MKVYWYHCESGIAIFTWRVNGYRCEYHSILMKDHFNQQIFVSILSQILSKETQTHKASIVYQTLRHQDISFSFITLL